MKRYSLLNSMRTPLALLIALLLGIVGTPLLVSAAQGPVGQDGSGKDGKIPQSPQSPNVYTLQGDTTNPTGTGSTYFSSSGGGFRFSTTYYDSDPLVGRINNSSSTVEAIYGTTDGTGIGVAGHVTNSSPTTTTAGIYGSIDDVSASQGYGVKGEHMGGGTGVYGVSASGYGGYFKGGGDTTLKALPSNTSAWYSIVGTTLLGSTTTGVYGSSDRGDGVYGTTYGGTAPAPGANGAAILSTAAVYGYNYNVNGGLNIGNSGVSGYCGTCVGVSGQSDSYFGVYGTTTGNMASAGGYFTAIAGSGVVGVSNTRYGVSGSSTSGYGVYGTANTGAGVYGSGGNGYGIYGSSVSGIGLRGTSVSNIGIYASTSYGNTALRATNEEKSASYYAGYFDGNVRINGNYVATGTKSAAVPTNSGDRLMYAEEATQNYFSDQGTGYLKDGMATIKIDPLFAQTVSLGDGYQIFLTPGSFNSTGLAYGNTTTSSFEVRELNGGKGSYPFTWRIAALRKGYEKDRMAPAPPQIPLSAPNLTPDNVSPSDKLGERAPLVTGHTGSTDVAPTKSK